MKFGRYEIAVTVRANCRTLRLRYRPSDGTLSLSVPPRTPKRTIEAFLDSQRDWIEARMGNTSDWRPAFAAGERHLLLGQYVVLGENGVPAGQEAFLRYRVDRLKTLIARLLPVWEKRMGVNIARVTLREMTSRWGSCRSDRATLSLNARLALVPPDCVEQVLVHELCHLFHPDHSAAFYAEMTRFLPDWPERKRRLDALDLRPLPPA